MSRILARLDEVALCCRPNRRPDKLDPVLLSLNRRPAHRSWQLDAAQMIAVMPEGLDGAAGADALDVLVEVLSPLARGVDLDIGPEEHRNIGRPDCSDRRASFARGVNRQRKAKMPAERPSARGRRRREEVLRSLFLPAFWQDDAWNATSSSLLYAPHASPKSTVGLVRPGPFLLGVHYPLQRQMIGGRQQAYGIGRFEQF